MATENENLDEAKRPADQDTGDKSSATLPETGEQKKQPAGKNANKRPADQSGDQDEHDPSNLDNQGDKQENDLDADEYDTRDPEKTAKTVKEEFESDVPSFKLDEELGSLLESEDLSDDFRSKATLVFESAINTILEAEHSKMVERFGEVLEEALETQETALEEKVSKYVDYVAEEWMEENKLAVETGIRHEMNEAIVSDIRDVLAKHNINLDEEAIDVVEEERTAREAAEKKLDEQIEKSLELKDDLKEASKLLAVSHFSRENSLTMVEEEKLMEMVKTVEFEDFESFTESMTTLKENYFTESTKTDADTLTEDAEGDIVLEEKGERKEPTEMDTINATIDRMFSRKQ